MTDNPPTFEHGISVGERPERRKPVNQWIAIIAGYAIYALATWVSEALLARVSRGFVFYLADIGTQFIYSAASGALACTLCHKPRTVFLAMSVIGLIIGAFSVTSSWSASDPHWYSLSLYVSFAPSVGFGVQIWCRNITRVEH